MRTDVTFRQRHILVCLDGSPLSAACLPYAVSLAQTFGATITLARVIESRGERIGDPASDAIAWALARQEADLYLGLLQRQMSASLGSPVEVRVEQGRAAARIADLARELHADVTVIASRGDGAAAPRDLGSTAQQLITSARSSLFIVHASSSQPSDFTPRRILVPLDGSSRTESVLPSVARMARTYGAEVLLLHVVRQPIATALFCDPMDVDIARSLAIRVESAAHAYLETLREHLSREVGAVRAVVASHANERQCILELVASTRSDLVLLSAHGSACNSRSTFGSVAEDLLRHSPVPVLVLQDLPLENVDQALSGGVRRSASSFRTVRPSESA